MAEEIEMTEEPIGIEEPIENEDSLVETEEALESMEPPGDPEVATDALDLVQDLQDQDQWVEEMEVATDGMEGAVPQEDRISQIPLSRIKRLLKLAFPKNQVSYS